MEATHKSAQTEASSALVWLDTGIFAEVVAVGLVVAVVVVVVAVVVVALVVVVVVVGLVVEVVVAVVAVEVVVLEKPFPLSKRLPISTPLNK